MVRDGVSGSASGSCAVPGSGRSRRRATGAFVGRVGHALARARRLAGHRDRLGAASRPLGQGLRDRSRRGRRSTYAFAHHDVDAVYSVILHENTASQAVARRARIRRRGKSARSSHFPSMPHVIWRLQRRDSSTTSSDDVWPRRARRTVRERSASRDVERFGDACAGRGARRCRWSRSTPSASASAIGRVAVRA